MNRNYRAQLAAETVEIATRGWYLADSATRVDLSKAIESCIANTRLLRTEDIDTIVDRLEPFTAIDHTRIEVVNETSLSAAARLVGKHDGALTLCLNFASAKNAGGGFLGGSQAQEESLAHSSSLYASIAPQTTYYESNRASRTALYTEHMILSPEVPVFRNDEGQLLSAPYTMGVLTAPAVNAGAVRKNEPGKIECIRPAMAARITKVLAVAAQHDYKHLVLGAWGCGVFQNDPDEIAALFVESLLQDKRFQNRFQTVIFAVLDGTSGEKIISPFRKHFLEVLIHV